MKPQPFFFLQYTNCIKRTYVCKHNFESYHVLTWAGKKVGIQLTPQRNKIFLLEPVIVPPRALMKWRMYSGWALYVAPVIRLPSAVHLAKVSASTQWAPAEMSTGFKVGYAVHFRPLSISAAAKISCPWQIAAIGFPDLENKFTNSCTDLSIAWYSAARPPGISSPSYLSASISSKVAFKTKLWPLDSE